MFGLSFRKVVRACSTFILASLPIFSQVAPPPPAYPQQPDYTQQQPPYAGAADGGDQQEPGPGAGVARISLLNGDVSMRRGDSGEYVAAQQNAPVMMKDSIQTGAGARSEVQFDATSMIRMAQNTEVNFTNLEPGRFQLQLGRGTVTYRILRDTNLQVEIDTPSVSIRPARQGIYRITVTDDGLTYVTPRLGQVEIFTPKGSQMVQVNQTLVARGDAADPEYQVIGALNRDDWDAWSDSRDQVFQQAWSTTSQYVPPDVYGTEELQGHGQWVNTPEYGYAWAPSVGPDWSPYSVGRWSWEDFYGWTWVSYDPWGWAPYHYGRWFNRPGFGWCWWPGRLGIHHYWSPGLVAFAGFGYGGGGYGRIGWVPLAPYERYHAWYGRGGYRSTNIISNANITNTYRNARVNNGVVAVNAQHFGRVGGGYTRVSGADLRTASTFHGGLPVRPTSQSMRFTDRQTSTYARTNFAQSRFATAGNPSGFQRPATASSNWNRYSSTSGAGLQGARQFGSTPGTRTVAPPTSGGAGWNRFNQTAPSSGSVGRSYGNYGNSTGRSQLQISPPIVRQRGSYNAPSAASQRYSAPSVPRYSAPSTPTAPRYSAPQYHAPSYSQPHYSAPSMPQRSAPAPHYSAPGGGGGGPISQNFEPVWR